MLHLTFLQALLCSFLLSQTEASVSLVVSAPNVLRVGTPFTMAAHAEGATQDVRVLLSIMSMTLGDLLDEKPIVLSKKNNYAGIVNMTILPRGMDTRRKTFVELVAECQGGGCLMKKTVPLLVSFDGGHLFVQTDKPVYNPTEKVKFRVFPMDLNLVPSNSEVTIDIISPDGVLVERTQSVARNLIISGNRFFIPPIAKSGNWRIVTHYSNFPAVNATAGFEVKEHVLPRYEVKVKPQKHYFEATDKSMEVSVTARYTFGEPVAGRALIRFGLKDADGDKILNPHLKQFRLGDGKMNVTLELEELIGFLQPRLSLKQLADAHFSIVISATVIADSSGEVQEGEVSNIRIVTTPYEISLERCSLHFKPGFPYILPVIVYRVDGEKVRIPVKVLGSTTLSDGSIQDIEEHRMEIVTGTESEMIFIPVNTFETSSHLSLTVTTAIPGTEQASTQLEVTPYKSSGGQLLHISPRKYQTQPGKIDFQIFVKNAQPSYVHYLVISRGRILHSDRIHYHTALSVVASVDVTADMIPSFRVLAFYLVSTKMVADSVLVYVKKDCKDEFIITPNRNDLGPGEMLDLKLEGAPLSRVALVAVDQAAYLLNSKNRLRAEEVWQSLEHKDLGCTHGSGANTEEVFHGAGVVFVSTQDNPATHREEFACPVRSIQRSKRSLSLAVKDFHEKTIAKENEFTDPELKRCCRHGLLKNLLELSCSLRARRITSGEGCVRAFRACCDLATSLRKPRPIMRILPISAMGGKGFMYSSTYAHRRPPPRPSVPHVDEMGEFTARSYFATSWFWMETDLSSEGKGTTKATSPESITTWDVQAVAVTPSGGLCVAEPKTVRTFKSFFISLLLPYSVVRNEQTELRAILHNYKKEEVTVFVRVETDPGICTAVSSSFTESQTVTLAPGVTKVFPIAIAATKVGNPNIMVFARSHDGFIADGVSRRLRVVSEGIKKEKSHTKIMIAKGGTTSYVIKEMNPPDLVPGTDSLIYIKLKADEMAEFVDGVLETEGTSQLLRLPTGCGEQTMIYLAPTLSVTRYLDSTQQWRLLGGNTLRNKALDFISRGYARELGFRKEDGSYAAFPNRPSSTWLTAFVAKIFAQASNVVLIDEKEVCRAASWIATHRQDPDGSYREDAPVIHQEMQGGVTIRTPQRRMMRMMQPRHHSRRHLRLQHPLQRRRQEWFREVFGLKPPPIMDIIPRERLQVEEGAFLQGGVKGGDGKLALTAFVTVGLKFGQENCTNEEQNKVVANSLARAVGFLRENIAVASSPYAVALASYALTLANKGTSDITLATTQLRKFVKEQDGQRFWLAGTGGRGRSAVDVEATGYGLLQTLLLRDWDYANPIVTWLVESRNYGGGFSSTQDTVVALEALTLYRTENQGDSRQDLSVTITTPTRNFNTYKTLTKSLAGSEKPVEVPSGANITVQLQGYGKGVISVLKLYYAVGQSEGCNRFHLEVSASDAKPTPDGYSPMEDAPTGRLGFLETRRRVGRSPVEGSKGKSIRLMICVRYNPSETDRKQDAGMTILDVTGLSGFTPNIDDLDKLKNNVDKFIDNYEWANGHLIIYLESVSYLRRECIAFRMTQEVSVVTMQPAAVSVFEYYAPERHCTTFYHPTRSLLSLPRLCDDTTCKCAAGQCPTMKPYMDSSITVDERMQALCDGPTLHFAYKVQYLGKIRKNSFLYFNVKLVEVLKRNKDQSAQAGAVRKLIVPEYCWKTYPEIKKFYLVMGRDGSINDEQGRMQYVLDGQSWMELWPAAGDCTQSDTRKKFCQDLETFSRDFHAQGCQT